MAKGPRRAIKSKLLSLNELADTLECSREKALLLELEDETFPQHYSVRGKPYWDTDEIQEWVDSNPDLADSQ